MTWSDTIVDVVAFIRGLSISNEPKNGLWLQAARTQNREPTTFVLGAWLLVLILGPSLTAAEFQYPLAVAAKADGPIYVADRNLPGIWTVKDGTAEILFQGSKKFRTPLNAVRCLAIDAKGRLLAGDSSTRQVYRFEADKPEQPVPLAQNTVGIGIPMAMAVNADGTIFVADLETHRIWKLPAEGGQPEEFIQVPAPRGLAFDDDGQLWVVSHGENQLLRVDAKGTIEPIVKGRPFQFPHNVVIGENHVAYVSDGYAKAIWKVDAAGKPEKWISGDPLKNPVGLARLGEALLIADPHAKAVFKAAPDGTLTVLAQAGTNP